MGLTFEKFDDEVWAKPTDPKIDFYMSTKNEKHSKEFLERIFWLLFAVWKSEKWWMGNSIDIDDFTITKRDKSQRFQVAFAGDLQLPEIKISKPFCQTFDTFEDFVKFCDN